MVSGLAALSDRTSETDLGVPSAAECLTWSLRWVAVRGGWSGLTTNRLASRSTRSSQRCAAHALRRIRDLIHWFRAVFRIRGWSCADCRWAVRRMLPTSLCSSCFQ
eukprot:3494262-Rhodomonas_salina.4